MKYMLAVSLAAWLCAGALVPTTSQGASISISIGDHGYYNHGPWYWNHGVRYYWVPGHYRWHHGHQVWVHGYYVPR